MGLDLQGKIALITGAAKGIGRGVALELACRGADIIVNDWQSMNEADELAATINSFGRRVLTVQADISDAGSVELMVAQGVEAFGGIDILVNNAAFSVRKPFLEISLDEAARSVGVSQWGTYLCSHFVARHMVERGAGGSIVMIGSVHGERPYPNASAYNMAKAGVRHLAASLALELAPHSIRVNTIEPGWVDTPGERLHNTEDEIHERGLILPMGRLGTAEEIARAVAFLCSSDASYITGSTLRVDGGFALKF